MCVCNSRYLRLTLLFIGLLGSDLIRADDVLVLHLTGTVSVAAGEYIVNGIDEAHEAAVRPHIIILEIDTPGGLDSAMRVIIKRILSSQIPVIGFVSPQGARAASAGTFILYACHIAAMSHATTLGAATPVQLTANPAQNEDDESAMKGSALQRKALNDAIAYIEGFAELRKRNRKWAAEAVRSAASLEAQQALTENVINLIAESIPELLEKLHRMQVSMDGSIQTLNTQNAHIIDHQPNWRHKILAIITDPNIAYLLLMVGIHGLLFEASNPGLGIPGILGALCILLSLYAFQLLPVNYAGMAIMIVGVGLMIAEAFAPSFGIFGVGGTVALVLGSLLLFDSTEPAMKVAFPIILSVALFSAAFFIVTLSLLIRHRRSPLVAGAESLCGETTTVDSFADGLPVVRVQGELWKAKSVPKVHLQVGDNVEVLGLDGLTLLIKPTKRERKNGNNN